MTDQRIKYACLGCGCPEYLCGQAVACCDPCDETDLHHNPPAQPTQPGTTP